VGQKTEVSGSSPCIEVTRLVKKYGDQVVLDGLSLLVNRGELLVLLGESGSGKSTLLKLLCGLESAQSGSIRVDGKPQSAVAPHQRDFAIIFQDGNGYSHLTVRENLGLAAKHHSTDVERQRWIDALGLRPHLEKKLPELSGGQLQRVAMAKAMLSGKSILLMDEPLAHLNQKMREEVRALILRIHRETGKTILYVTHDFDEALYMATRIAVIALGQILQIGDPRAIYNKPKTPQVARLLGQPTIDVLSLPRHWLDPTCGTFRESIECGMRSHDWILEKIELAPTDGDDRLASGMKKVEDRLSVTGRVVGCRWMGPRWLVRIEFPSPLDPAESLSLWLSWEAKQTYQVRNEWGQMCLALASQFENGTELSQPHRLTASIDATAIHAFATASKQ